MFIHERQNTKYKYKKTKLELLQTSPMIPVPEPACACSSMWVRVPQPFSFPGLIVLSQDEVVDSCIMGHLPVIFHYFHSNVNLASLAGPGHSENNRCDCLRTMTFGANSQRCKKPSQPKQKAGVIPVWGFECSLYNKHYNTAHSLSYIKKKSKV